MPPTPETSLVDARGRKYLTGCRVSEALAIRACDVDLDTAELRIATLKRRRSHCDRFQCPRTWSTPSISSTTSGASRQALEGERRVPQGSVPGSGIAISANQRPALAVSQSRTLARRREKSACGSFAITSHLNAW